MTTTDERAAVLAAVDREQWIDAGSHPLGCGIFVTGELTDCDCAEAPTEVAPPCRCNPSYGHSCRFCDGTWPDERPDGLDDARLPGVDG